MIFVLFVLFLILFIWVGRTNDTFWKINVSILEMIEKLSTVVVRIDQTVSNLNAANTHMADKILKLEDEIRKKDQK